MGDGWHAAGRYSITLGDGWHAAGRDAAGHGFARVHIEV
jgi:hypothetical protein